MRTLEKVKNVRVAQSTVNCEPTMKSIRAARFVKEINCIMHEEYHRMDDAMHYFLDGTWTAAAARRVYRRAMQRVTWYQNISDKICIKYGLAPEIRINVFEPFIKFFEF